MSILDIEGLVSNEINVQYIYNLEIKNLISEWLKEVEAAGKVNDIKCLHIHFHTKIKNKSDYILCYDYKELSFNGRIVLKFVRKSEAYNSNNFRWIIVCIRKPNGKFTHLSFLSLTKILKQDYDIII